MEFGRPVFLNGKKLQQIADQEKDKNQLSIESAEESSRRAKSKFLDYVVGNDFTHWGMITFDQEKCNIDRYDLEQVKQVTTKNLKAIKRYYDPSLEYLLIFEPHKNGGWHAHVFLYTEKMESFVKARHYQTNKLIYDKQHRQVFVWSRWAENVGFATFVDITHTNTNPVEKLKMAQYTTKYVTKNIVNSLAHFNKKKYWVSKGLKLPEQYDDVPEEIFEQYQELYKKDYQVKDKLTQESIQEITITFYNSMVQYSSN